MPILVQLLAYEPCGTPWALAVGIHAMPPRTSAANAPEMIFMIVLPRFQRAVNARRCNSLPKIVRRRQQRLARSAAALQAFAGLLQPAFEAAALDRVVLALETDADILR